jgi:prepilin-type processing-associated H-X9-DG protein
LPAVSSAIESARRTQCANNLKQIGLATTQYETSQRQYPLNWGQVTTIGTPTTGVGPAAYGVSWLASLLPGIDEGPLYSEIKLGQALGYVDTASGINNLDALTKTVKTFLCPSDTQSGQIISPAFGTGVFGATNYKGCAGSNWATSLTGAPIVSVQGRNANSSDGVDHGNGIICRGGGTVAGGAPILTANMDIRDGASKTFLAGEAVPQWCDWSLWFWFDGSTASCGMPMNYRDPGVDPTTYASTWQRSYTFMSRHRSGCNFGMCDGSVTYLNEQIDLTTYQAMATISGNEPIQMPTP